MPPAAARPPGGYALPALSAGAPRLCHYTVPTTGEAVRTPGSNRALSQALTLPPGTVLRVQAAGGTTTTTWEVFTDTSNHRYLRCRRSGAVAYFESDDSVFYCTAYYGPETAWLYGFYLAAYRIPLTQPAPVETRDVLPLSVLPNPLLRAAQDVLAPFWRFVQPTYCLRPLPADGRRQRWRSHATVRALGREHSVQEAELLIQDGGLSGLHLCRQGKSLTLTITPGSR